MPNLPIPFPLRRPALRAVRPLALLGLSLAGVGAAHAADAAPATTPQAVVDSMEAVFGPNTGRRRNHTKGLCAEGRFTATPQAARYSRSPLFNGQPVPVQARFSLAGGRATAPDTARSPRGLALQFQLPGGALHQMAMLNVPVFSSATPESFFARLDADRPDPATGKPDPARQKAVAERYTDNKPLAAWMAQHRPPPSFANASYHGLHAFRFVNAQDQARWVKWRFVPRDGEQELSEEQLKTAPADFLAPALAERLRKGPVEWDMVLTLGQDGDPLTDPTQAWPAGRTEVSVGTLQIQRAGGSGCEAINFDPLVLSDGVQPSPDPVLAFRSPAYATSWVRRQGEAAKGEVAKGDAPRGEAAKGNPPRGEAATSEAVRR
ncbi:catalase family peroxidase [Azohydromonas caseinilytica]|uniref:Catalase-related peroxidase n=1 Tax=Azohydromonas caseinilytica TaxID=2728836 RepID=A0A848FA76_9BURK|nr:catalase family peroxidase [Azohydromonas caseinilytica]NML16444.1 catalase family peroxidase [Azohydromonas caseinilytica]